LLLQLLAYPTACAREGGPGGGVGGAGQGGGRGGGRRPGGRAHLVVVPLLHLQRLPDGVGHLQAALQRLGRVVVLGHHDAAQQRAIGAGLDHLLVAVRGRGALGRRGPEGQHGLLQAWGLEGRRRGAISDRVRPRGALCRRAAMATQLRPRRAWVTAIRALTRVCPGIHFA
jgi:hypothetical protein